MRSNEEIALEYQEKRTNCLFEELLGQNIGLIKSIVIKFVGDYDDLEQEAKIAFERAARTFSADGGAKFSTLATIYIRRQLAGYCEKFNQKILTVPIEEYYNFPAKTEKPCQTSDLAWAIDQLPDWKKEGLITHFFSSGGEISHSHRTISGYAQKDLHEILLKNPRFYEREGFALAVKESLEKCLQKPSQEEDSPLPKKRSSRRGSSQPLAPAF